MTMKHLKLQTSVYDETNSFLTIDFDRAIIPSSVSTEDICISIAAFEEDALIVPCMDSSQISLVSISSSTTDQLVLLVSMEDIDSYRDNFVNSSAISNTEFLTIEFNRNAVLGTDLRIVEDYQVEPKQNPVTIDIAAKRRCWNKIRC